MKGHGRSRKVKEAQGRAWMVFSHHWIDISGEKSYWWVGGEGGGLLDYIVSPSPIPFPLDFGFRIWDLDLGLD